MFEGGIYYEDPSVEEVHDCLRAIFMFTGFMLSGDAGRRRERFRKEAGTRCAQPGAGIGWDGSIQGGAEEGRMGAEADRYNNL